MDIAGMRARRQALGAQALTEGLGPKPPGAEATGTRALHLARGVDSAATGASGLKAVRQLGQAHAAAGVQVSSALQASVAPPEQTLQDVRQAVPARQRGGGVHMDAAARTRLRHDLLLSKIADHFSKADPARGGPAVSVPYFPSLWAGRAADPTGFELMAEYAYRNQSDTDIAFLRAVDTLQKNPTIDGARRVLQTFIEPLPVDDFGIEIAVPGRSVLNMVSDGARKELLTLGQAAIGKAMRSGDPADLKALGSLFDGAARQAAGGVAKNMNTLTSDLRRWEGERTAGGGTGSRTIAG